MLPDITAVIVTRGDHDLTPILKSLPFKEVLIWDNSRDQNLSVYGRYAPFFKTKNQFIYVQDDDCIVPAEELVKLWDGNRKRILLNMPANHGNYTDSGLVGWGAIFYKELPRLAFSNYLAHYPDIDLFERTCDIVFTTLTPFDRVDLGHENLPYAYGLDRMYHQPNHDSERQQVLEQARRVRDL